MPGFGAPGWILVTGAATSAWAVLGHRAWKWLHRVAVTLLMALCLLMTWIVLDRYGLGSLFGKAPKGDLPWMVGLDLVIAMPISWLPLVCDYSRYARSARSAFWGTWVGYFLLSSWMYAVGLLAALAVETSTPESMVLELMVNLGLVLPAILIVLFSTFTTTFLDIYSAAVSALNLHPGLGERRGSLTGGVMGTILALLFPASAYEGFLLFIGSVFCPLFGVVLADYFVLRKGVPPEGEGFASLNDIYPRGVNVRAFVAWAGGFALYHLLQWGTSVGSSIPSLLTAGGLYMLLMAGGAHLRWPDVRRKRRIQASS